MKTLSNKTIVNRPDIDEATYLTLKQAVDQGREEDVPEELLAGYQDMITGKGSGLKCNVVRMLVEHYEVMHGLTQPRFAYVSEKADEPDKFHGARGFYVTGWMGNVYGRLALGREYRGNFGDVRRSVSVTINDREYYGTYFESAGDYCRLKPRKAKGGK